MVFSYNFKIKYLKKVTSWYKTGLLRFGLDEMALRNLRKSTMKIQMSDPDEIGRVF